MKMPPLPCLVGLLLAISWPAGAQIYDTNDDVAEIFAGSGTAGSLNAQGTLAMFSSPSQIVADTSSNLYVLDPGNSLIRKITTNGTVSTFVGGGNGLLPGYGTSVSLASYVYNNGGYGAMAIDGNNNIWIACTQQNGGP